MGLLDKLKAAFGGSGGGGRSLDELATRMQMTAAELRAVTVEYREFPIRKRTGPPRTIAAPAPDLKRVQRRILKRVLGRLRAHEAVLGFARGVSFVDHARLHAGCAVVVRLDVRDFFPSTTAERVTRYLRAIGWGREATAELVRLCCHRGALPQGAPTSPRLSNLVNGDMDRRLAGAAASRGALYSRYADDIVFSFHEDKPGDIRGLITFAATILYDAGYAINRTKGPTVLRRHQRQMVTGLVVNDGPPRLPRKTRRWLRAVEHRAAAGSHAGKTPTLSATQLAGWRALRSMVQKRAQT